MQSRRRGGKQAILWLSHMGIHERQAGRAHRDQRRLPISSAAASESSCEDVISLLSGTGLERLTVRPEEPCFLPCRTCFVCRLVSRIVQKWLSEFPLHLAKGWGVVLRMIQDLGSRNFLSGCRHDHSDLTCDLYQTDFQL